MSVFPWVFLQLLCIPYVWAYRQQTARSAEVASQLLFLARIHRGTSILGMIFSIMIKERSCFQPPTDFAANNYGLSLKRWI